MTTTFTSSLGTGGVITQVSTSGIVLATLSPPAPDPGGSLTVVISRMDTKPEDALVAPVEIWFTAVVLGAKGTNGDDIAEPPGDTAVVDRTSVECTFDWDFGDPGYTPVHTPNTALFQRDTNRASVKRPVHVFHSPGNKTVSLQVTDAQGNTGVGFFTFSPTGDAPAIADPETHFVGRRVYFSPDGIFPEGSATADQCTTVAQVHTRLTALVNGGSLFNRLDFRRGEVYTDQPIIGQDRNLYISTYGTGARPRHVFTPMGSVKTGPFKTAGGTTNSWTRIIDQDCKAPWDSTTETGRYVEGFGDEGSRNNTYNILVHRCTFDGFNEIYISSGGSGRRGVFSDTEITNWSNYGYAFGPRHLAVIGCDFHQHEDALTGMSHGNAGTQDNARMGNRHGPIRLGELRTLYVACSSFFSRNGWSPTDGGNWTTLAPTEAQLCFRHSAGGPGTRSYIGFERNSLEGGPIQYFLSPVAAQSNSHCNIVFDSNIFCGSHDSADAMLRAPCNGARITNNYFVMPEVATRGTNRLRELIDWLWTGAADPNIYSPVIVEHNTAYMIATSGQLGGNPTRVLAKAGIGHTLIQNANLYYAPNFSTPIGASLAPFDTPTLAGFAPRHKGRRWNFPPIGHQSTLNSSSPNAVLYGLPGINEGPTGHFYQIGPFREGGAGAVAHGEWMAIPYPDLTGFSGGAVGQVTRSMVESDLPSPWSGPRFHQFSLFFGEAGGIDRVRPVHPANAGGNGGITMAYTDTHIRVQNTSNVTWPADRRWYFWLDLREHLMDHLPGTASPTTIPLLRRQAADVARGSTRLDITGAERASTTRMGAVEALPA
jgi:hypothetical protein